MHSGPGGIEEDYQYEEDAGDTTARGEDGQHEQARQYHNNSAEEGDATAILEPVKPKKSKRQKSKRVSTTPPSSSSSEDDTDHVAHEDAEQQHEFHVPPRKPGKQSDGTGVEPSWAEDTSPFEQLRQDIQKVRIDASYSTSSSYHAPAFAPSSIAAKKQQQQQVQEEYKKKQQQTRLRDLSMDSPDFERPALQTMSFQHPRERLTQQYNQAPLHAVQDKGKGRAYQPQLDEDDEDSVDSSNAVPDTPAGMSTLSDLSSLGGPSGGEARPGLPHRKSSGTNNQNALLQKVLMKNLVGKDGRPNLSTPATKRLSKSITKARKSQAGQHNQEEEEVGFYPQDLPSDWNGLADLSKAPLSAYESPQKKSSSHAFGSQRSASRQRSAHPSSSMPKSGLPSSISSDSLFDNSIFRDESGMLLLLKDR